MDSKEFKKWRKKLNKTQKEIAQLLGLSVKAVHSYEQGWRNIPAHVERQMFFPAVLNGWKSKRQKALLGYKKLSPYYQGAMSGMGISGR